MTTQIMFKIDEKLKKAAQKKAKEEGVTLSDFYQSATKSFVEGGLNVGIIAKEDFDDWRYYTKESMTSFKKGIEDYKKGRFFRVK